MTDYARDPNTIRDQLAFEPLGYDDEPALHERQIPAEGTE